MKNTLTAIAFGVLAATAFQAKSDALIGPMLESQLPSLIGDTNVVVSTHEHSDLDSVLGSLSVPYLSMQTLPMAGARVTKTQIQDLAQDPRVKSIYLDAPLEYYNYTSGQITGGHYVHDVEGVTGKGATIAVLDSGVDGTHPDLALGEKTIQNVKIIGDLDFTGGKNVYLDGQPNSDTSSGHGTHVAGTVAGSGEAGRDDQRRSFYHAGIAPDAKLVGIGAGDGISILYALAGLDYAIANSERYAIDVITNSWGGGDGANFDPNNPINQASYAAYKKGIVVTFAASNSGPADDTLNQYAIAPWVINVAAGTASHELADFSSRGVAGDWIKTPDITAPGSNIISTRAINTALPILSPVNDPAHPEYHLYYAGMSGTSMATPFVAGVVGLLLEVNPDLSPDQIERILKQTADTMDNYQPHQVGAGYINVKDAVALAGITVGERVEFETGNTGWSSQGEWQRVEEQDANIHYLSRWKNQTHTLASSGTYRKTRRRNAELSFDFIGDSIKLNYLASNRNGHADVYLNGKHKGTIDYYSTQTEVNTMSLRDLDPNQVHTLTLRRVNGTINFDSAELDGELVDAGSVITNEDLVFNGNIGPSVQNLQISEHMLEIPNDVAMVSAVLNWDGIADLDFELVDGNGNVVANSSTLENPEEISFRPAQSGIYTFRVNGFVSASTDYEISTTLSHMSN